MQLGDSWLELPVRPARPSDADLPAFGPSVSAPQTPCTYHPVEGAPRRIIRDLLSGKMVVDFPRWTYSKTMPDIDQTQTSVGIVRYEITDGDPTSAAMSTDYQAETAFPNVTIRHHSTGRLSCTATHFRVQMTLELGTRASGTYAVVQARGMACRSYAFELVAASGVAYRHPARGHFRTAGEGRCRDEWVLEPR